MWEPTMKLKKKRYRTRKNIQPTENKIKGRSTTDTAQDQKLKDKIQFKQ